MFKFNRYAMFGPINWYQVIQGIGLIDKEFILGKTKDTKYKNNFKEDMLRWANEARQEARDTTVMSHKEFLNCVNKSYIKKYEN